MFCKYIRGTTQIQRGDEIPLRSAGTGFILRNRYRFPYNGGNSDEAYYYFGSQLRGYLQNFPHGSLHQPLPLFALERVYSSSSKPLVLFSLR